MANAKYRPRGDTAANWTAANPVLALRELGIETDTRKIKIGDGATAWTALGYVTAAAAASGALTASGYTVTTARLLGRTTAGTGAPEELTAAAAKTFLAITAADLTGLGYFATGTDAANLTGTVAAARMPAQTGDATSAAGSTVVTVSRINGVALSGLGTGILKNTTGTGVPSIAIAADFPTLNQSTTGSAATLTTGRTLGITGDLVWTSPSFNGSGNVTAVGTIQAGVVTLAKMANLAANSIIGNNTGAGAVPLALTATQVTAMLDSFAGTAKGLVPASAGGTVNFLRADGTWAAPPAGGSYTFTNTSRIYGRITAGGGAGEELTGTQATSLLDTFTSALKGLVPASGGGTTLFLRADGTWATPPGGGGGSGSITVSGYTMNTARFLGRTTAAAGAIEELTAAGMKTALAIVAADVSGLAYFATGTDAANLTGTVAAARLPAMTGDVTAGVGTHATTIAAGVVSNAKLSTMPANTFKGNNTAGVAAPVDLTVAQAKTLLAITAADVSGLAYFATGTDAANLTGTVAAARLPAMTGDVTAAAGTHVTTIANDSVTNLKIAPMPTLTIKGNITGGTAGPTDLTVAQVHDSILVPQIQSVASSATVTPTFSNDQVNITALAVALALANPTGTAIDGYGIAIRIKDNGTARAITYGTQYRALGVTLPTTTVAGKTLYLGMVYNAADTKWDVLAVAQEA